VISARRVRVAAFQLLYGLDAHGLPDAVGEEQVAPLREQVLAQADGLQPRELRRAERLALSAYAARARADAVFSALSPGWPVSRQAAVDRAILRLAFHEMASGATPPGVAINEAVELARQFSTEKSPGFINALLDEARRGMAPSGGASGDPSAGPSSDSSAGSSSEPSAEAKPC